MPVTDEIRARLAAAGIRQIDLTKAGIGTASARRLLGKEPGPVSLDTLERAAALIHRELTTRKRRGGE